MQGLDRDMKMRVYIMDSLVAKSGQSLSPTVIGELTQEILARMVEVSSEERMDMAIENLKDILL